VRMHSSEWARRFVGVAALRLRTSGSAGGIYWSRSLVQYSSMWRVVESTHKQ
jgi:hypothetical protein